MVNIKMRQKKITKTLMIKDFIQHYMTNENKGILSVSNVCFNITHTCAASGG